MNSALRELTQPHNEVANMLAGEIPEALTFDDVSLVPARSGLLPTEADTTTRFSRNIPLNIPITSAAMDTVTESHLAIAIAQQGCIGVVHKNLSIDNQRDEVDKLKRSESGMIVPGYDDARSSA